MDIVAKPIYKFPLIGKVKSIHLYSDDKLIAHCVLTGYGKSTGEFDLMTTDNVDSLTIKFKDKLREDFEVVDKIEKRNWTCEYPNSDSWISYPKPMTIKSENHIGKFSKQGLIYLDEECIGRLGTTSKYPFGPALSKIEVRDKTYINLLMSICLVNVLRDKVYKVNDWGD